jgi:sialidase-1
VGVKNALLLLGLMALILPAMAQEQTAPAEKGKIDMLDQIRDQATATILDIGVIWEEDGTYVGWPSITRTSDGELIAVFSGDRERHVCPWGKTQLVRSSDNGKTWTKPETINNTPLDDRDAGIIQTKDGTLLVSWFTSLAFKSNAAYRRHLEKLTPEIIDEWLGYWVRRSEDNGKTWGEMTKMGATTPHGPIQLKDGRLLYVGLHYDDKANAVMESKDDGRTWQRIAAIAIPDGELQANYHEPHVVETADGKLVAMSRYHEKDRTYSHLRQAESEDGGQTWTTYRKTDIWGYPPHLIRLQNDWLLLVYGVRREPFGERACISRDGGKTWDLANEITLSLAPNGDLGYPASTQLDDGSIMTVYYEVATEGGKPGLKYTHWRLKE